MRVLILEDEPVLASHMATLAQEAGCTIVACVTSVRDALGVASHTPIDLLVADVDLGRGGDGVEAARQIRECCGVRTVFVTGQSDAAARDRAQFAWPAAFLVKPFTPATFCRTIRMIEGMVGPQHRPAYLTLASAPVRDAMAGAHAAAA